MAAFALRLVYATNVGRKHMRFGTLPKRLFVTGTDTGIGKTVVCAVLMAGLRGFYWKPIQSGLTEETDTQWVKRATGLPAGHFMDEAYKFQNPLSPHASAAIEGIRIDMAALSLPPGAMKRKSLIVEGAGGVMVPLNESHFMLDLIKQTGLPALLVARSALGTINHSLLSLEKLRRNGVEVAGVVLNGPRNPENREAIEYYGNTEVLAELAPLPEINHRRLEEIFSQWAG